VTSIEHTFLTAGRKSAFKHRKLVQFMQKLMQVFVTLQAQRRVLVDFWNGERVHFCGESVKIKNQTWGLQK